MINLIFIFVMGSIIGFFFGIAWVFTKKPDAVIGTDDKGKIRLVFCKNLEKMPSGTKIMLEVRNPDIISEIYDSQE